MTARLSSLVALTALLIAPALAKDKKKPVLPEYVLRARTVRVVIDPDAGEPLDRPRANAIARENVEKALSEWGRFTVVMEGQESDLVIAVRTGNDKGMQPTVKGGPIDQRPGVAQGTDSTVRIGGQRGQNPMSDPNSDPIDRQPHMSNEVGPSQDMFAVYRGDVGDSLDSSPEWRLISKDCLQAPNVSAVEAFRKALADAEKPTPPPPSKP
jgi:hypothetical protein